MMRRKKWIRNLLSFLTILCCLAGSITPVFASGTGSDVPRVTFTNEPRNSPDLYVTKTVENALEGAQYAAPEHAVFRFVLKLNGKVAGNVPYRVLDPVHGEIIRKTSGTKMDIPFQTEEKTGVFTLEAGQQAWFEGLGTGTRYEVEEENTYLLPKIKEDGTEEVDQTCELYSVVYNEETGARTDTPLPNEKVYVYDTRSLAVDGWTKKSPSGGSTGEHSILANGSSETFINRYTGKGTGTTATLTVSKSVSFPTGFQAPDSTPEFPFVIELEGKPYANEAFTATNSRTGETRSMTTDSQGRFNLQGGWTASFENVPADVDYKVYEDTEAKLPEETRPEGGKDTDMAEDTEDSGGTQDTGIQRDAATGEQSGGGNGDTEDQSGDNGDTEDQPGGNGGTEDQPGGGDGSTEEQSGSDDENTMESEIRSAAETLSRSSAATKKAVSGLGSGSSTEKLLGKLPGSQTEKLPGSQTGNQTSGVVTPIFVWPEGWWPTDDTVLTGSVQSPLTELNFHNSNVSFVVTKRLEDLTDGSATFTFRLADEDNNALGNVEYYLYHTNGEPVYDGNTGSHLNGVTVNGNKIKRDWTRNGTFTLEPGQAAVFVGLKPGTSYRVTETKDSYYTQVLPPPTEDMSYTVPSDGQVSSIDFVNRPEDMQGTLSVTKNVTYATSEGELGEDEFHFILYWRLTEDDAKNLFRVESVANITEKMIRDELQKGGIVLTPIMLLQSQQPGVLQQSLDAEMQQSGTMQQGLDTETQQSGTAQQSPVRLKAKAVAKAADDAASGGGTKHTGAWICTIGTINFAVYAPAKNRNFEIPGGVDAPLSCQTGPWKSWLRPGEFALKNGQTARFQNKVKVGDEYLVREIGLSEEYREVFKRGYQGGVAKLPDSGTQGEPFSAQYGMIADGADGLSLTFENEYTPKKIDLVLTKTDGSNVTIANEAHFMLYRTEGGLDNPVIPNVLADGTVPDPDTFVYKTENGVLTIPNLKAGTYWLYERKAPSGYCLLPEPVEIDLAWTESGLAITIDGAEYVRGSENDSVITYTRPDNPADAAAGSTITVRKGTTDTTTGETINTAVGISIRNTELYELPSTGGIGIYWYSIGGTLLMLAAALILYKYQRRGRC